MCPTYLFRNDETGEEYTDFMSIKTLDVYLKDNPHLTQLVNGAPMIHSGRGLSKPDDGFRDLLKDMKKKHSGGISKSTINTH
jgi:hypothetical protein